MSQYDVVVIGGGAAGVLRDELPDIPGLRDRWARDVLHCPYCPYCHGDEVRDRQLGVLGDRTADIGVGGPPSVT